MNTISQLLQSVRKNLLRLTDRLQRELLDVLIILGVRLDTSPHGLRRRAFTAAKSAVEGDLPRGWTTRRDWLGRLYYFDHLTWESSKSKPNPRPLYCSLGTDALRVATLVPSEDFSSILECLIVAIDKRQTLFDWAKANLGRTTVQKTWYRMWSENKNAVLSDFNDFMGCAHGEPLSYCWGDPSVTETAILNGQRMEITTNLAAALRQLRANNFGQPLWLWVDAICINQEDIAEKASQIQAMGTVFAFAPFVHVWLGPSDAFLGCRDYLNHWFADEQSIYTGAGIHLMNEQNDPEVLARELRALSVLKGLPYWSRKWIIQEVCLARKLLVHCGDQHFVFNCSASLALALRTADNVVLMKAQRSMAADRQNSFAKASRELQCFDATALTYQSLIAGLQLSKLQSQEGSDSVVNLRRELPMLLNNLRLSTAGHPLDAVYALQSLFGRLLSIRVNYSWSPSIVYTLATYSLLQQTKSLNLLQQASFNRTELSLPSWAIDFGLKAPTNLIPTALRDHYDASKNSAWHVFGIDYSLLRSKALLVDTIAMVCDCSSLKPNGSLPLSDNSKGGDLYAAWQEFISKHEDATRPCHKWSLLTQGVFAELEGEARLRRIKPADNAKCERDMAAFIKTGDMQHSPEVSNILCTLNRGTLFVTTSGRFGAVTDDAKVRKGDRIVVLASACLPFCVRDFDLNNHTTCNSCESKVSAIFYQCVLCRAGNFMVCEACFAVGKRCEGENHQMLQHKIENDRVVQPKQNWGSGEHEEVQELSVPATNLDFKLPILQLLGTCYVDGIMEEEAVAAEALKRLGDESRVDEAFDEVILV